MEKHIDDLIRSRKWSHVQRAWDSYLQYRQPPPAGSVPSLTFSQMLNDGYIFVDDVPTKKIIDTQQPRAEIGEVILNEAIYWLHKALHVLAASECHINSGMPSWSISSAYQSSYFACRAILGFMGIGVGEIGNISVVGDLCRDTRGLSEVKLNASGAFEESVRIRSFGILFDHRQIWYLFQRAVRTSRCDIWPEDCVTFIQNLNIPQITRQRHGLHYDLAYWVIRNDMDSPFCPDSFVDFSATGKGKQLYNTEQENFSVLLAKEMVFMALSLFRDIPCSFLSAEKNLIENCITDKRHPFLLDRLSSKNDILPEPSEFTY